MKEQNKKYILDVAEKTVGKNIVLGWKEVSKKHVINPDELYLHLAPQIEAKIKKMTSETLGRISSFGDLYIQEGFDENPDGFIFRTAIEDVHLMSDFSSFKSGRDLLEEISTSVIVATICDIIDQDQLNLDRIDWETERAYV